MQVKEYAQSILTSPFKGLEDIPKQHDFSDTGRMAKNEEKKMYFQETFAKKGSSSQTSMAQKGIGNLTQFNPAAAMSAKSFSV